MVMARKVSRGLTKVATKYATPTSGSPGEASGAAAAEAPLSTMEGALEAWVACRPDGLTMREESLPQALPTVARYVSDCIPAGADAEALASMFTTEDGEEPLFQRMLKVQEGRVQFLHFWRAFSIATGPSAGGGNSDEGLTIELETLRDGVLRLLDATAEDGEVGESNMLTSSKLVEAMHVASAMSRSPDFWRATEASLANLPKGCNLNRDEVTIMMLQWLRTAIGWRERVEEYEELPPVRGAKSKGLPVLVHIYDVSQEDSVHKLNKWLAHKYSPLKFGGIFHAGVEINGLEWSFGMSLSETMPGVSCCEPRSHPAHRYRQTVRLKNTQMSPEDAADLISRMLEEYPGDDYDLLRRNCCHFADDFARRLGAGRIPRWVHRLARVGARVDGMMQAVSGRTLLSGVPLAADSSDDDSD